MAALIDKNIKRTLQTEGIVSLRLAVERAKTLKFINLNCFPERRIEEKRDFNLDREEMTKGNFQKFQKGTSQRNFSYKQRQALKGIFQEKISKGKKGFKGRRKL